MVGAVPSVLMSGVWVPVPSTCDYMWSLGVSFKCFKVYFKYSEGCSWDQASQCDPTAYEWGTQQASLKVPLPCGHQNPAK